MTGGAPSPPLPGPSPDGIAPAAGLERTAVPPPPPLAAGHRTALGQRLAALASVISMVVLVYTTMGFLLLGFISTALPLIGLPIAVWAPLDAIAALGLAVVCGRWGIRSWPIELQLTCAAEEPIREDGDA